MNKLTHGDCLEVMRQLIADDVKVDAIIADPPYGTIACGWDTVIPFDKMWPLLHSLVRPDGAIVLFGSEPFSSALRMSNIKKYKYDWYWNKGQGLNFVTAKYRPLNDTECISVFADGACRYFPIMEDAKADNIRPVNKGSKGSEIHGTIAQAMSKADYDPTKRYPKTSIFINSRVAECNSVHRLHPTQKPVTLMEYLIKTYTQAGDTVLDFTMGSGITGVAFRNTGQDFIGIEKDEKYFTIATERISTHKAPLDLFGGI